MTSSENVDENPTEKDECWHPNVRYTGHYDEDGIHYGPIVCADCDEELT